MPEARIPVSRLERTVETEVPYRKRIYMGTMKLWIIICIGGFICFSFFLRCVDDKYMCIHGVWYKYHQLFHHHQAPFYVFLYLFCNLNQSILWSCGWKYFTDGLLFLISDTIENKRRLLLSGVAAFRIVSLALSLLKVFQFQEFPSICIMMVRRIVVKMDNFLLVSVWLCITLPAHNLWIWIAYLVKPNLRKCNGFYWFRISVWIIKPSKKSENEW